MLRIFLTVSVLFGHQIAAQDPELEVIELCEGIDCVGPDQVIQDTNYDEVTYVNVQWVETEVHGTDLEQVLELGLDKLFKYSRFGNAEETIVPITAPWFLVGRLVNGTFPQRFNVGVTTVPEINSPPTPTDQTIKQRSFSLGRFFVRTIPNITDGKQYEKLILDFVKDLEEDKKIFNGKFIIVWYWLNFFTSKISAKPSISIQAYLHSASARVEEPYTIGRSSPLGHRTFNKKFEGQQYEEHVITFMKDLEQDNQQFNKTFFYSSLFNKHGLMEITFMKKQK
ncbi:uncharacterized protein [Chiloscyllium punctatum]|uniref:uncharacterized protein n=1 Tax=Chiloscyllium punctatum TaxID=137246 RepID=UPI003B635406